jgi:hypothetical protein
MDDTSARFNTLPRKFQNTPKILFTNLSEETIPTHTTSASYGIFPTSRNSLSPLAGGRPHPGRVPHLSGQAPTALVQLFAVWCDRSQARTRSR